jgi:integrase
MATLKAENINWSDQTICYDRQKTGSCAVIQIGKSLSALLRTLPSSGYLFPCVALWVESDRAKAFGRRCRRVGVAGVSLHSYRYAWAERARQSAYPQRYAQAALGHKSKAVHDAYAKKAEMRLPSLEDYEKNQLSAKVISLDFKPASGNANEAATLAVY